MKIFFTGSPRALKFPKYKNDLIEIFSSLSDYGENLSRLVIDANPDEFYSLSYDGVVKHYQKTIDNLKNADVVVAEVSMQSMSMGYLINKSLELSKPTLCLHSKGRAPFFLSGIIDSNLIISEYSTNEIKLVVDDAFDYFAGNKDKRFNLMLPPKMLSFLNEMSKKQGLAKAEILRTQIRKLMQKSNNQ
ncbi:hypothetical protein KJZ63_04550 [Patescibacteria group bacterium]|nr:hypothetical protein [Patescibacteria group bacterium]